MIENKLDNDGIIAQLRSLGLIREDFTDKHCNITVIISIIQELVHNDLMEGSAYTLSPDGVVIASRLRDMGYVVPLDAIRSCLYAMKDRFDIDLDDFPALSLVIEGVNKYGYAEFMMNLHSKDGAAKKEFSASDDSVSDNKSL